MEVVSYTSRELCGDVVQHANHFPLLTGEEDLQPARTNPTQAVGRIGDWLVGPLGVGTQVLHYI